MSVFQYVKPFLKKYWPYYFFGTLLLMAIDGLQLITPLVVGAFTDALMDGTLTRESIPKYIIYIMVIATGVAIGRFGWRMTIIKTARRLEYWLRNQVFTHLEKMSLNYFNHHKTGDLMAHCTNDINAVRNAFGGGVIMFVDAFFMGLMTVTLMATRIDLKLTLVAFLPLPLIVVFIITLGRQVRNRFQKVQEAFSQLTDVVQESFSGIRIIKSFVQEKQSLNTFNEKNENNFRKNMHMVKLFGFVHPLVGFISMLSTLIAIVYGGRLVIDGGITIGKFVSFLSFVGMLAWPMMALGFVYNNLQRGMVSLKRLNVILDTPPEIIDLDVIDQFIGAYKPDASIEFDHLTFTYPGTDTPALNDISFELRPGETLAVVGKTGSGKTTLVNLILRLYQVPDESIKIGGVDLNRIPIDKVRSMIGYVPQDNFLFSRNIAYNLRFGNDALTEDEMIRATKSAQVYDEIMSFPKAFNTELGERGVNMSGGQKQRVSIARALAMKPDIIILDDSLSAVDTKTEESILQHLKEDLENTTSILIAHRISTIKHADQIIVLDQGELVEKGTHESLLQLNGHYADMYQKQLLEEKLSKE
ncbi:ABC transporter ATP-binding protein [Fusibacter tunisiensis]|uniref:ATP-binding cassette subfamily B protein n=1 Tax=Fusibacter tunisiensis TaxID=1008308 RepID=A0ABS2MPP1_9FIRM|nr:ABC transporter ATP-binding protein [Fusibacter tunisiensis]MBM7561373.1 ATP-binding cassette subfamily B protein [Fusibacter tunisiensis]